MKWSALSSSTILIKSPPSRGAWIEIEAIQCGKIAVASPPSRGAWIEMPPGMSQ